LALTLTKLPDSEDYWGKHRVVIYDITGDTSYPTGGYAVTAAGFGMRRIYGMKDIGGNATSARLMYRFDTTNTKIIFEYPTGGGATTPTTLSDPAIAAGAVAVTSAAANGSADVVPGRGAEVGSTTDVSTVTVRFLIIGE